MGSGNNVGLGRSAREKATQSVYSRVFTVFGAVTLAVVGVYLLWRARQAEMSAAMTTAGWAILVMVAVTAIAAWPVRSAHLADQALVSSLGAVHNAVGPPRRTHRPSYVPSRTKTPARPQASGASGERHRGETMLYRNWLRGVLGSAENTTAQKYGDALYRARTSRGPNSTRALRSADPGSDDRAQVT